ncbi:MAG: hypothetical protein JW787_03695 [Sedimentisphaerales bacterium]|nr:hypothetical protein [Sedimentisphaerales bacterium]
MTAGYLIVKTYERKYREYLELREKMNYPLPIDKTIYSIPWKAKPSKTYDKQYRGVSRDPLFSWDDRDDEIFRGSGLVVEPADNELEAHLAIGRLAKLKDDDDDLTDLIESYDDTVVAFNLLKAPIEREIIWIRDMESDSPEKAEYPLLGYEPAYFEGDWFSTISDCMCFPVWHGTDSEGTNFKEFNDQLNKHALFDTPDIAKAFLEHYLSFDWTEHVGEFRLIEVRLVNRVQSNA